MQLGGHSPQGAPAWSRGSLQHSRLYGRLKPLAEVTIYVSTPDASHLVDDPIEHFGLLSDQ
jgi:hypothetical protein